MQEWIERAVLLDPDDLNMRCNLACVLVTIAHDPEAGLDMLGFVLERCLADVVNWAHGEADLDPVREHPGFRALVAAAQARLGTNSPLAGEGGPALFGQPRGPGTDAASVRCEFFALAPM